MTTPRLLITFLMLIALNACAPQKAAEVVHAAGLYNISVMYPASPDKTFDMDYYEKNHMPMMARILGKNLKFYEIDKGKSGRTPNDPAPFVAICHFYCYDGAEYSKSIASNRDTILKDIAKYTNIQPVVQMSEVRQIVNGVNAK